MPRTEGEKMIMDKGKLWQEFKTTLFGRELFEFFDLQEKLAKDAAFEQLVDGDIEVAESAARKLAGILAVKSYIDDSIVAMNQLIVSEREAREGKKNVPSHV